MFGEIAAIESQTEIENALVIDKEVEFCALMKFYLARKNFNVSTSYNLTDALVKIEMEKPEVIIADKTLHPDLQYSLTEKINSITGYSPKIFFVGTYLQEREGPFIYTLKRDYYKKNYHKSPSDFWEEIIQYLKDLFK
jgi:CheY-like chemotaxis protein